MILTIYLCMYMMFASVYFCVRPCTCYIVCVCMMFASMYFYVRPCTCHSVCVCVMFTHMYFCVRPHTCHSVYVAVRQRTTLNGEGSSVCPCASSSCCALVSQWATGVFSCLLEGVWGYRQTPLPLAFKWVPGSQTQSNRVIVSFFTAQKVLISSQWHKMQD